MAAYKSKPKTEKKQKLQVKKPIADNKFTFLGVAKASSDLGEQDQAAMEVHILMCILCLNNMLSININHMYVHIMFE